MNYQECLEYLYEKLPMFSRTGPAALKPDLTNTLLICKALGQPHEKIKTIHIAGTNGKGSTSHLLASIFQESGYKTGLYTSPHLMDFRERIKVNGALIPKESVISFVEHNKELIEALQPSFFEVTVGMAFDFFAKENVDIAIIETGLGGRLDSTNIITPEISVITNIGFDHTALLGNTLEAIASEKAGIIKKRIPIVVGTYHDKTWDVFKTKAAEMESPIFLAEEFWENRFTAYTGFNLTLGITDKRRNETGTYNPDLKGTYQAKNLLTVLESVHQLRCIGWNLPEEQVMLGIGNCVTNTGLWGRWQLLGNSPAIIADVGHNEDGINQVLEQLKQMQYSRLHWILGMVKDKDINKILEMLPAGADYYFTQAQLPRALEAHELSKLANSKGLKGSVCPTIKIALDTALKNATQEDLVLICGSVFIVGEALEQLGYSVS